MKYKTLVRTLLLIILFGNAVFFSGKILGISVVLLRDAVILMFVLFVIAAGKQALSGGRLIEIVLVVSLFLAATFLASLEVVYPALIVPLYFRLLVYTTVVILFASLHFEDSLVAELFRVVYFILSAYVILSLGMYVLPMGRTEVGAMEGFSGQHFSKFVYVICVIFFLTTLLQRPFRLRNAIIKDTFLLFLSVAALVLVLQRGAILAVAIGLIVLNGRILPRKYPLSRIAFWSIFAASLTILLSSERFVSYAFFEQFGPKEIYNAIIEGNFSLDMIRARGRFQIADAIVASAEIGFLGNGPGVAKHIVGAEFFEGREPHNDILMFLVDLGVFGTLSVSALLLMPLLISRKTDAPSRSYGGILFTSGAASMIGFFAWMAVSNVVIYLQYNLLISAILILIGKSGNKKEFAC